MALNRGSPISSKSSFGYTASGYETAYQYDTRGGIGMIVNRPCMAIDGGRCVLGKQPKKPMFSVAGIFDGVSDGIALHGKYFRFLK